jgi:hypothetical protein
MVLIDTHTVLSVGKYYDVEILVQSSGRALHELFRLVGQAELSAETPELALFARLERGHGARDPLHVNRKRAIDDFSALVGEVHDLDPSIGLVPGAANVAAALEVIHYGGHVAAAPEDFLA